jgi:hypothetical protein
MSNAAFEGYFHIFILVYHLQHGYNFWMMLSYSCIWMNVGKMHPPRLTVGPSALKLKCTLHRMNTGDEHHWWCHCISFHDLIWQAEKNPWRRTLSLQRWALLLQGMRSMSGWLGSSMKTDDNIYLKSIVSTGGKFMTDWPFWWVLAWRTQPIRRQFSEESRRENPSWWIKQHHTWG